MHQRLRRPERHQVAIHSACLDELLDPEHKARVIWEVVGELDLSMWLKDIKAVKGSVGRDATDPCLLVSLWILAVLEGVGSARALSRLCETHIAYQWLCGGVSVNYHLLSDFRSKHTENWKRLFTQVVSSLLEQGLVDMKRVAQDGMRVRANAAGGSFRTKSRLEQFKEQVEEQLEALEKHEDESFTDLTARAKDARIRAQKNRQQKIEEALKNCNAIENQKKSTSKNPKRKKKESRSSTTDPDARVMKFSNGGFSPGYNVQFSTDVSSGFILGVDCTNAGSDSNELVPMLEQLKEQYQRIPEETLVDGGFASIEAIRQAEQLGTTVYAPLRDVKRLLAEDKDPYQPKYGDSPEVASWRLRMGTEKAKKIYALRGQSAEWVNAMVRNRGLRQMPVRGLKKCKAIATIYALVHNLFHSFRVRALSA